MTMDTTTADSGELPGYPIARQCPYRPPTEYDAVRRGGPVTQVRLFDGRTVWAVTGDEEARRLLTDPRLSSSRKWANLTFPVPIPSLPALDESRPVRSPLIATDPPSHNQRRRIFIPYFTVRRMNSLRPGVQAIVDERIDAMLAGGARTGDLVEQFSLPIPSIVICELLGVPYEDHAFFEEQSLRRFDPVQGDAMIKLYDYLDELIRHKAENPGDGKGLLAELLDSHVKDGTLDHAGLVMFALELLIGGHDTTANMIALGVLTLLEHPDQLEAVKQSDQALTGAVEELLRSLAIVNSLSRVAAEDIEIAGRTIPAGDGILISPPAVNHDASVMAAPEEFRVDRTDRRHIAFGYGSHQCLGQNLARLEMEVAFRTLFTRIPDLRLAVPLSEVPPREGMLAGVRSLPVAW